MVSFHVLVFLLTVCGTGLAEAVCDGSSIVASSVLKPGDLSYDGAREQWASHMATTEFVDQRMSPEFIVYCDNDDQVVSTINFANECDYKISIRSGGHQYAGMSSCVAGRKCIQLDVSHLEKFVHVPGTKTITLGVGLTLSQMYQRLIPLGLVIPGGICNTVGVGGHFQSSSLGYGSRTLGLGMDFITSFRIALADGTIKTAVKGDPLYFATLGGNPGSFGVVLDYTFEAESAAKYPYTRMVVYVWPYDKNATERVLIANQALNANEETSRDFMNVVDIGPNYPAPVHPVQMFIKFIVLWTGIDHGDLTPEKFARYLQPVIDAAGIAPVRVVNQRAPMHYAFPTLTTSFDNTPNRYHLSSAAPIEWVSGAFWKELVEWIDLRVQTPNMYPSVQINGLGGVGSQMELNGDGRNAFPFRNVKFEMDDWSFYLENAQEHFVKENLLKFRSKTDPLWKQKGALPAQWFATDTFDVQEAEISNSWRDYYPKHKFYKNLQDVKDVVDPCDLFSTDMTVAPRMLRKNCPMASKGGMQGGSNSTPAIAGVSAAAVLGAAAIGFGVQRRLKKKKSQLEMVSKKAGSEESAQIDGSKGLAFDESSNL